MRLPEFGAYAKKDGPELIYVNESGVSGLLLYHYEDLPFCHEVPLQPGDMFQLDPWQRVIGWIPDDGAMELDVADESLDMAWHLAAEFDREEI